MRIVYCDPGLHSNVGHFATHCRLLTSAFKELNSEIVILASKGIDPLLKNDLSAFPVFNASPYLQTSNDPLCGWIKSYFDVASLLANDLSLVEGISKNDLVFYDAATPAALYAIFLWMHARGGDCPRVVVSLIEQTGMIALPNNQGRIEIKPVNVYPTLYRYSGILLSQEMKEKIRFITVDETFSEIYTFMIQHNVHYVPHPYSPVIADQSKLSTSSLTVGFVGAQRANKGFNLVPEIIQKLLAADSTIQILVQDGRFEMQKELKEISQIAETEPRLKLVTDKMEDTGWANILSQCNLLVAPYNVMFYGTACSGICCEALANGIPLVAPENTTLSRLMRAYGSPGTIFTQSEVSLVVESILESVKQYDDLFHRAQIAKKLWSRKNGPIKMANAILTIFDK